MILRLARRLLDHQKMKQFQKELIGVKPGLSRKLKYLWKETKYTIIQGFKDLWSQSKWYFNILRSKQSQYRTGQQLRELKRINYDLIKFVPYSVFLIVPFTQLLLPFYLYYLPNSIPSFFVFDTVKDKKIQDLQKLQYKAYEYLFQKLQLAFQSKKINLEQFEQIQSFKINFYKEMQFLQNNLNYRKFQLQDLQKVAQFLGIQIIRGNFIISKTIHVFTLYLPKIIQLICIKILKLKIFQGKQFIIYNKFVSLNFWPLKQVIKKFILFQIDKHLKQIRQQDQALQRYGVTDIMGKQIKQFTRQRGITSITCYQTLKVVLYRDWVQVTTHPKFTLNTKIWYSIMLYHFLKRTNNELN